MGEEGDECVVRVEWSEPFISCGSVSQYVLTVTPPTSDCQSGSSDNCQLTTDGTRLDLTLRENNNYSLIVRPDNICNNGTESAPLAISLTGQ